MRQAILLLVLASLATAPLVAAAQPATARASWADAWARAADADLAANAHSAAACALGDIDHDGIHDVLLRSTTDASAKLQAVSGADPQRVLWESALDVDARLTCAADVGGDGVADPVIELVRSESEVPDVGAVSAERAQAALHALDGVTGKALLELEAAGNAREGTTAAASGSTTTDVTLEPGANDLYLFVTSERTSAAAKLLDDLALSSEDADVSIQILDATGQVLGTIEAPDAHSEILSHAVVRDATDKARILVLSATEASPIDQAPAQVPTIASHAVDGSLLWSVELDATASDLLLVPQAGDLDADGIQDLIVETIPSGAVPVDTGSLVTVLSGADGSVLLDLASKSGLVAALPLGDLTPTIPTDADALLTMTQETADGDIHVECLHEGVSCWTATLPAGSVPVNGAIDPFTGDLQGFADLTGDKVPDVATLAQTDAAATLSVVSGVDGKAVWSAAIDAGSHVVTLPDVGGADLLVLGPLDGARTLALSKLEGLDGSVAWRVATQIAATFEDPAVDLDLATSTADDATAQTQTILATVRDAKGDALAPEHVYAIQPKDGVARWAVSTDAKAGAATPPPLHVVSEDESTRDVATVPAPGALVLVALVGAAAFATRRARR